MSLGGSAVVHECSFVSNFAYDRGLAIAAVGVANVTGSSFDGNDFICTAGSYRSEPEEVKIGNFEERS